MKQEICLSARESSSFRLLYAGSGTRLLQELYVASIESLTYLQVGTPGEWRSNRGEALACAREVRRCPRPSLAPETFYP
jgi:hypothetical protein